MIAEYAIGGMYVAAAPVDAGLALALTIALHRLLLRGRLYRWFWLPILADTALFVIVWELVSLWLLPLFHGTPA